MAGAPKGNQNAKGHKGVAPNQIWFEEDVNEEADYLIAWAMKEDSLVLGECYGMRGYTYQASSEWAERNEKFRQARIIAKTIVGARREKGALLGKLDSSLVRHSMALYDPEYRAYLKEMKRDQIIEDIAAEEAAKKISDHIKSQSIVSDPS